MKTYDERRLSVYEHMQKIRIRRRRTVVTAASLCLVLTILGAVLFVPFDTALPDVSMYAGSEYYGLIQQLNEATYEPPRYVNRMEALLDKADFAAKGDAFPMEPGATMANAADSPETGDGVYVEVTDNQVSGVTEADIFKRSDKYVYYLRGTALSVYSIEGENSRLLGEYRIDEFDNSYAISKEDEFYYYSGAELYLSFDCSTVSVVVHGFSNNMGTYTALISLDVMDPANISERNRVYFTGSYVASRMVGDDILLTYNYRISTNAIDFDEPSTFVPQYGTPEDMKCIPGGNIICPENVNDTSYTVVCKLDSTTLEVKDTAALLSYSDELYVSQDTIFATHSYSENFDEADGNYTTSVMTEITGIAYNGDTLQIVGNIALDGRIKDQYSMDQYDGTLRVVTSTVAQPFIKTEFAGESYMSAGIVRRNVNLYCVDLENWSVAASVLAFAPDGEDAQSVRFDGPYAYVCTAEVVTLTDPVYFFDLTDLSNITWKDTGTIEGYSTSLINLSNGYLLGIGFGVGSQLKAEIYEQTQSGVISVCAYERSADFPQDYKAYLVDREKNLIGLDLYDWDTCQKQYVVLHFDGYQIVEVLAVEGMVGHNAKTRAFIDDGFLYVFSDGNYDNFKVVKF